MAHYNREWEELGKNVQDIIDQAICSRDYNRLNQTIRQTVGRAVDLGSDVVRKAMDSRAAAGEEYRASRPAAVQEKELPVLYGNTGSMTTAGVLKACGGGLLIAFSCALLLGNAVLDLLFSGSVGFTVPVALSLAGMAGGGLLLSGGLRTLGRLKRFKIYRKTLGQKTHCTLERLAQSVGKNVKFVRREVLKMIDQGLFLQGHLDNEERHLITSHETYQHYEQSRLQLEERRRQEEAIKARKAATVVSPQVQEVLDRGNAFIAEIRRCNDAIPGEDISAKIYHMEMIIQRIFGRAETNPEIIPDLKKLMDYYLPMTVKLLNAYADMDAQPVQGENILNAKREIEDTLDTLNLAFEKLLDSVFADTAMDVSSDISVLKTLLAQEGLTEDELSKMKKKNNL